MRDFATRLHVKRAISPAAAVADNTPLVSQIIDISGYEGLVFLISIGQLADADATFAVLVQHGDQANLSDAVDVPDAQLTGTEAQAGVKFDGDDSVRKIGYVGSKRYVRLTITPANNSGNAFISASAALFGGRYAPAPNPPA